MLPNQSNPPSLIESQKQAEEIGEFTQHMTRKLFKMFFHGKPTIESTQSYLNAVPMARSLVQVYCAERRLHPAVEAYITLLLLSALAGSAAATLGAIMGIQTHSYVGKVGEEHQPFDPSAN